MNSRLLDSRQPSPTEVPMRRIGLAVSLALGLFVTPLAAEAQEAGKVPRIGVLSGNRLDRDRCLELFRQGLGELGYVEGKTHGLEVRWAEGRQEPFPALARDLVALKVDLIVSFVTEAHSAVKQATATIPIVMAASTYPLELGLVTSLSRPGGNI